MQNINIRKIIRGDKETFKVLFESFFIPLSKFVEKYGLAQDEAEDVAQESLVKYWQRRADFDNIYKVRSFLYITAKNGALNIKCSQSVFTKSQAKISEEERESSNSNNDDNIFYEAFIISEVYRLMHYQIEQLPTRTKEIVKLQLEGLSNKEISEKLGISIETTKTLKKLAKKKLSSRMSGLKHIWDMYFNLFNK